MVSFEGAAAGRPDNCGRLQWVGRVNSMPAGAVTGRTISAVNSHKVRRHQFHQLKSYPIVNGAWSENFSAL